MDTAQVQSVHHGGSLHEGEESEGALQSAVDTDVNMAQEPLTPTNMLDEVTSRLVWSRLHEVESLKDSLNELSVALAKVETIRQRMQTAVDKDLASAVGVASTRLAGRMEVCYAQSFSQFFRDLIAHMFRAT